MNDDSYNSNGVYRWIITKTGDNVHSSTSGEKKGSIFTNKNFNISKKFSEDIEEVLSINENELFIDNNQIIQGTHNGESWEINITKAFTLKNDLVALDLRNGIVIHTNNRIFKENIAHFNIYSKRGEETHTVKVADNDLNVFMLFNMINIFSYLTSIKSLGVDPYMILDAKYKQLDKATPTKSECIYDLCGASVPQTIINAKTEIAAIVRNPRWLKNQSTAPPPK